MFDIYYRTIRPGYDQEFQNYVFSGSAYRWHQEVITQCLRLIMTGVLDRFANLQLIIGHMGEGLPFFYERILGELSK